MDVVGGRRTSCSWQQKRQRLFLHLSISANKYNSTSWQFVKHGVNTGSYDWSTSALLAWHSVCTLTGLQSTCSTSESAVYADVHIWEDLLIRAGRGTSFQHWTQLLVIKVFSNHFFPLIFAFCRQTSRWRWLKITQAARLFDFKMLFRFIFHFFKSLCRCTAGGQCSLNKPATVAEKAFVICSDMLQQVVFSGFTKTSPTNMLRGSAPCFPDLSSRTCFCRLGQSRVRVRGADTAKTARF